MQLMDVSGVGACVVSAVGIRHYSLSAAKYGLDKGRVIIRVSFILLFRFTALIYRREARLDDLLSGSIMAKNKGFSMGLVVGGKVDYDKYPRDKEIYLYWSDMGFDKRFRVVTI